jgi:ADP-ribose pyrophosphatase
MPELTPQQHEALESYVRFMEQHPECFANRERRPIIHDRASLESYAAEQGIVLGLAATTRYIHFVIDLVESQTASGMKFRHPYMRLVSHSCLAGAINTVVLATIANAALGHVGDIVLLEQERHATGMVETELPRGLGEVGLTGEQNALKELQEETGFIGAEAHLLGSTYTDSGLMDSRVSFYHVHVTAKVASTPENQEAITRTWLASREEVWDAILEGRLRDSFTLQAIALYEKHSAPR